MNEDDNTVQEDVQVAAPVAQPTAEDVAPETLDTPDTTEPSEASQAGDETTQSAPDVDEQLTKFAKSQGIDLDSPSAIKAAQIAMKARSEATRNHQRKQELEKATNITQDQLPADATPQQVDNARVRNLEMRLEIQSWKSNNPNKVELEGEMVKLLSDPNKKYLVQEGLLSLDDIYSLAKASAPDNSAEVKSQGKQEALRSLAHKQQAAVPKGHATNPGITPKEKPFKELSIAEMEARLGYAPR